ncbi:hypothetical protein WDW86_03925 [Bdellovibrionota bacterium FG-2]
MKPWCYPDYLASWSKFFLALALILGGCDFAKADEVPVSPSLPPALWVKSASSEFPDPKIYWVDWRGQRIAPKWRTKSRWFFDVTSKESPVGHPVLRTWVELPASHKAISLKGSSSFKSKIDPEDQPFGALGKIKGSVLRFDLDTRLSSATLEFLDQKGRLQDVGFWVELEYDEPVFWLDRSCWNQGVSIRKEKIQSKFLYAGIVCEETEDEMKMVFLFSLDAQWVGSTWGPISKTKETLHSGSGWMEYVVAKPKGNLGGGQTLGNFSVAKKGETVAANSTYSVLYRPKKRISTFSFGVNLGPSYLSYYEAATRVKGATNISEVGLTLKGGGGVKIIPKKVEALANGFITLLPLTSSPSTLPSARFFGINGRLGYMFNAAPLGLEWSFWSGWYVWGMSVSGNVYGVKFLSGPQVLFQVKDSQPGKRSKLAYLKLAPIASGARVPSLSDREVALGGSFQFNAPGSRWPLLATLDVAQTAIGTSMRLFSVSAGVQVSW